MKCFNPKVLAALAGAALATYLLAPGLFGAAVPLLALAACPLSMLLVMRGTGQGRCATGTPAGQQPPADEVARLRAEVARLRAEVARFRAEQREAGGGERR